MTAQRLLVSMGGIETNADFGLKVFMDAHSTVTAEEGDRYPLGPPNMRWIGLLAGFEAGSRQVRFLLGAPSFVVVLARECHAI